MNSSLLKGANKTSNNIIKPKNQQISACKIPYSEESDLRYAYEKEGRIRRGIYDDNSSGGFIEPSIFFEQVTDDQTQAEDGNEN